MWSVWGVRREGETVWWFLVVPPKVMIKHPSLLYISHHRLTVQPQDNSSVLMQENIKPGDHSFVWFPWSVLWKTSVHVCVYVCESYKCYFNTSVTVHGKICMCCCWYVICKSTLMWGVIQKIGYKHVWILYILVGSFYLLLALTVTVLCLWKVFISLESWAMPSVWISSEFVSILNNFT